MACFDPIEEPPDSTTFAHVMTPDLRRSLLRTLTKWAHCGQPRPGPFADLGRISNTWSALTRDFMARNARSSKLTAPVLDFSIIRELTAPRYANRGRPSIEPELYFRMELRGYLFGIQSDRQFRREIVFFPSRLAGLLGDC